jgi:disulfide bond formation protein DsbB
MTDHLQFARNNPPLLAAAIIAVIGAFGIAGFFFFEYVMLLAPCPLCLEQRYAFYVSVPLAALLWLGASQGAGHGANRKVLTAGFLVIAGFMLWNTGLAIFHAGVEWKWWQGPTECSGPITGFGSVQDMMKQLDRISLVRCDEAAWRFLGISLAGWNVPLSFFLAAVAAWGAKASLARPE